VSILAKILRAKSVEVEHAKAARSVDALRAACAEVSAPRGFRKALRRGDTDPIRVISEIKRASPSAGPIRPGADPAEVAREYAAAGAAAISVLTDREFFDGDLAFLAAVRAVVEVPLLRKDFIIDPYQVVEARAAGADAVLLIVAALDDERLAELLALVEELGMDALVEVHNEAEAHRAMTAAATTIGVNHRDLATFNIDMTLTGRLRDVVPADVVLVGESGIRSASDVRALADAGADAILVGERLMRAASPGVALVDLLDRERS